MKKKRPVLQDVADRVGVTKMTVSRFLRNPEQVSVALRGKIAAALDELGYIPNRAPDILSNATSRAIGVLLPSLTNQVFAEVLRGIEAVTDALDELIGEDYDSDRVVQGCVARFLVRAAAGEADEAAAELFRDLRPVIKARIHDVAERMAESEEYDRECAAERDHGEYLAERAA